MKMFNINEGTRIINELHYGQSRHATYLHAIYVKSPEIHILPTISILDFKKKSILISD